ncbi:ESCRT-1 complex, Vps28 subunit [Tilletiopsis washingtonensis]|uniref:Vacuolar protein sorting-associated protein 28 n=1 Tax=Tilletiopsis washingtonensis TaxID=58919 RepID=A0A316ZHI6_9BASI|nr:ESCRT-1 complex, Vps28 subunit [Tilletiopsis washingtonensis]PWO00960.1 ESCRT-1 complex, Vps28 subunit [Tilletiopsis washingtonensis]
MADINPYEEARLHTRPFAREAWENSGTLFALLVSLEFLERAYVRGGVPEAEYTPACTRLLAQAKTVLKLVVEETAGPELPPPVGGLEGFMKRYKMHHPAALHRISVGIPATLEHNSHAATSGNERAQSVAETTQAFITFMDALKLKLRAKDQLHPLLGDLMGAYGKAGGAGEGRGKLVGWLIKLNQLAAADEINEEDARQMLFDVEAAYSAWFASLQRG